MAASYPPVDGDPLGIQRDSSPLILDWCQAAFFEEPFKALAGFLAKL